MLAETLKEVARYFNGVFSPHNKHCCCSTELRDDSLGKCNDVVVYTDWDTKESVQNGRYDSFSEPCVPEPVAVSRVTGKIVNIEGHAYERDLGCSGTSCSLATSPTAEISWSRDPSPSMHYPSRDGANAASEETLALRDMMKRFVQDMIRGRAYLVVVENGQTEPCKLLLTPNLQYMQLEAGGVTHDIPLRNIKDMCPGRALENRFTPVVLDNLCSTLVLRNSECVTFRLSNLRERDEFTKCIKVLSLALE